MAEAKPLANWMFEQQKLSNDRNYRMQTAAARAGVISSLGEMGPAPAAKPLAPTHDWQHSDDLAARRAQGLEQQYVNASLDKDKMEFQMKLRQKYAPKNHGLDPVARLVAEREKRFRATDYPTPAAQRAAVAAVDQQLAAYPRGAKMLEGWKEIGYTPEGIGQYTTKVGVPIETSKIGAGDREASAKMRGQELDYRRTNDERRLQAHADSTLARIKPPDVGNEDPATARARAAAIARLGSVSAASPTAQPQQPVRVDLGGGRYATQDEDGQWVEEEPDTEN